MSHLLGVLQSHPLPKIHTRADRLAVLQFRYALTVAHDGLLVAAKLPELREEHHGEAAWIREDIRAMGGTLPEFDYTAACIVGSQFYLVQLLHPKVVLGYFAAFACCPITGMGSDWRDDGGTLAPPEGDRFPLLPMIEALARTAPWLAGHILHNATCTAAGLANVLNARLGQQPARADAVNTTGLTVKGGHHVL